MEYGNKATGGGSFGGEIVNPVLTPISQAKRQKVPLDPLSAAELDSIVRKKLATPKAIVAKVKDIPQ